jgi:hypothetical protein
MTALASDCDIVTLLEDAARSVGKLTVAFDGRRGWHLVPEPSPLWIAEHSADRDVPRRRLSRAARRRLQRRHAKRRVRGRGA